MNTTQQAKENIIKAGEQLFAENSIDAVSLRMITQKAGQKNASAINYHFGTKEGLIEAIFEHRHSLINAHRLRVIDELDSAKKSYFADLVAAAICPMADHIDGNPGGSYYLRFVHQVLSEGRHPIPVLTQNRHATGLKKIRMLMIEALSHLPPEIFSSRFSFMQILILQSLAVREEEVMPNSRAVITPIGLFLDNTVFVSNLIDAVTGLLQAPLSKNTQRAIKQTAG